MPPEVFVACLAGMIGIVAKKTENPPQVVADAMKNINSASMS